MQSNGPNEAVNELQRSAPHRLPENRDSVFRLPELYLYVAYPIIALTIMIAFPRFHLPEVVRGVGGVQGPLFFFLAGPPELKFLLVATVFYVPWRSIDEGFRASSGRVRAAFRYALSALTIYGFVCLSNFTNVIALTYLAHQDPARVREASLFLMEVDRLMWGGYPVFEVQRLVPAWLARLSIDAYLLFSSLALVTFFATMLASVHAFRRFMCAMMLWTVVALPLWSLFPAVSPDEIFRQQLLGDSVGSADITRAVSHLSVPPALAGLLNRLSKVWSNPAAGIYAVSCFPSFHVGGYLLIAYGLFLVHSATLLVMVPLCLLNTLGALYTLQHYLIDFFPAIALSLAVIGCVERCCPSEPRNSFVDRLYYPVVCAQRDVRQWTGALTRGVRQLLNRRRGDG